MRKFFYDILRDKGSTKFSITKVLAFTTFIFFLGYLSYYLFYLKAKVDHTLIIELIGFKLTLLGFKNGWGVKKNNKNIEEKTKPTLFETKTDTVTNDEKEGIF